MTMASNEKLNTGKDKLNICWKSEGKVAFFSSSAHEAQVVLIYFKPLSACQFWLKSGKVTG